jgi:DNA topoisomerase-1
MTIVHYNNLEDEILRQFDLIHIGESDLTITRCKKGKGYCFYDKAGNLIENESEKDRLLKLAVPPAYTDVLYAPYDNAHIQAVGTDSNQKKQYFYHEEWNIIRNIIKFTSLEKFGKKLPSFRRKIMNRLKNNVNAKETVIAVMFRILDKTGMRVGSVKAAKGNKTYGLTTLTQDHLVIENGHIILSYKGKGGVDITQNIDDYGVVNVLEQCSELDGQNLFQHEGEYITSTHINQTIKNHFGEQFSAKDFRTWRFSCMFLNKILKHQNDRAIILKDVLEAISERTGNTPAVLQSSYIHPGLIDITKNHDFEKLNVNLQPKSGLRKAETIFLEYLGSNHASESLIKEKA